MQKAGYSKTAPDKAVQAAGGCPVCSAGGRLSGAEPENMGPIGPIGSYGSYGANGGLSPANAGREMIVQNGFGVVPSVTDGVVQNRTGVRFVMLAAWAKLRCT